MVSARANFGLFWDAGHRLMGDHSKRERRREHVIEALDQPSGPDAELPHCHCGAVAKYEVNRGARAASSSIAPSICHRMHWNDRAAPGSRPTRLMPDRHRLPYRAAARGMVVCLTWVLCIGATSLPQRNVATQNATQQTQDAVRANPNPAPVLPPVVQTDMDRIARALEAANASHNPTEEARQATENLKAQKDIAFWGMVVAGIALFEALITAAGVTLVAYTLGATRRAANAAANQVTESRNAAARDLRPYVSLAVSARRWPNTRIVGAPGIERYDWDRYSIVLTIKNAGKTWAQNVRVQSAQVPNASGDAWTGHVNWSVAARAPLVIAPGEEVILRFGDDIQRTRLPQIRDEKESVFFAAWVIYDDPITDPPTQRQTRLYRVLNADREENVSFGYMPTNNCADDDCA